MRLQLKNRRSLFAFLGIGALFGAGVVSAQASRRIPLSQLEAMFSDMRAKTKWNIDGPLLWGYFFFDQSESKLQQISQELVGAGYKLVGLSQVEGRPLYRLHLEKVELHTPNTLNSRNIEFYALAEKYGIRSYDGMDVGPAPISAK
jgi:Regulator of ribonuclease activity B